MSPSLVLETFIRELLDLYSETFENSRGIYLDRKTSLFETLTTITAETASRPVSANCASLAAQVDHLRFYIDVLQSYMEHRHEGETDWDEIWNTVEAVTPEEWTAVQNRLHNSYQGLITLIKTSSANSWADEDMMSGAVAILVHSAYHLGEIRQALCTLD